MNKTLNNNTQLENTNNSNSSTLVVPYCYKVTDKCIPCDKQPDTYSTPCIEELAAYMQIQGNVEKKEQLHDKLFECLKTYGDIYKILGIELYVNPQTKKILFPDNQRIQSNINVFLRSNKLYGKNIDVKQIEHNKYKLHLYNILLNDALRDKYNSFYYSLGDIQSLQPKTYGGIRKHKTSQTKKNHKISQSKKRKITNKKRTHCRNKR